MTIIAVADPQVRGTSLDIAAGFQRLAQQGAPVSLCLILAENRLL
jgi:hypothetical protein